MPAAGRAANTGRGATEGLLSPGFLKLFVAFHLYIVNMNLFALVPYYLELRGAGELLYGAAGGMLGLGGVAAMALVGGLADRASRRGSVLRYLAAAGAGNVLALAAMGWAPQWYLVAILGQGVMWGAGAPVVCVWASELCPPERRTEAFAWLGIGGILGDSVAPLLGESLLLTQPDPGAPEAFLVVFVAAAVVWLLSVACFLWAPNVAAPVREEGAPQGLWALLGRSEFRPALLGTVALGGAMGTTVSLGKNFVASIGLDFVSVLLVGRSLGALGSRLALPWITARVNRVHLIPAAYAGVALGMGLLAVTGGYGLLATAGLIYGASHGILFPALLARLIDYGGSRAAGRISTLYMGMFSLGAGLLPTVGGAVLRVAGFPTVFALVAIGAAGAVGLQNIAERRHAAGRQAAA